METLTNGQRLLSIGVIVILIAVTHKYVIFALVYFTAFGCAYVISNALLEQKTPFYSCWVVKCQKYVTRIIVCLTSKLSEHESACKGTDVVNNEDSNQNPFELSVMKVQKNDTKSSIDTEIDTVVGYIIRDFVSAWFVNLSNDEGTVKESAHLLRTMFLDMKKHCEDLDQYELFERFLTLFLNHLHDYQLSVMHFHQQPKYRKRRDKERKEFKKLQSIEDCFDVLGKFHEMASSMESHEKELRYWHCLLDVIMSKSLPDESLLKCLEAKHLLVDIVACQVFLPLLDTLTDTHWLHKAIILITSDEEIELVDGEIKPVKSQTKEEEISKMESTLPAQAIKVNRENTKSNNADDHTFNTDCETSKDLQSPDNSPEYPQSPISRNTESQPMFYVEEDFQDCQSESEEEEGENISADLSLDQDLPEREMYIPDGASSEGDSPSQNLNIAVSSNACELSPSNLFEEVKIIQTENMKEAGGNGTYTMYCMQVTCWVHPEPSARGWRLQQITVRRRYREFLTLHERLEEHPVYKRHVKGIKGPTRWNFLGKLDQETVRKRQIFLQGYLQKLASHEALGSSMALREFLAYDGDANIAFVKKAAQSLDKVLVKTVSGVFDKLSSAFETKETIAKSRSNQKLRVGSLTDEEVESIAKISNINFGFSFDHETSCDFSMLLNKFVAETDANVLSNTTRRLTSQLTDVQNKASQSADAQDSLPLTRAVLDLALCSIGSRETWTRKHRAVHIFTVLLGNALEFWLQGEIEDITTKERFVHYIRKLRDTLWPGGELDRLPSVPPSEQQRKHTENQARRCLHNFFPWFLPHVVGQEEFDAGIEEVLSCIDHPRLNRSFVYQTMDWLLGALYPDISLPELQNSLLSQDIRHRHASVEEFG